MYAATISLSCMWSGVVHPRWRRHKTLSGTCLNVGAYSTHDLFWTLTRNILKKRKMFPFFQCHLSLTQVLVSFVHRPLNVEKVSAKYIEGGCGVDFVWFLSIHFLYDVLSVSKSPTDKYRKVQHRLCVINMQEIEKSKWKIFENVKKENFFKNVLFYLLVFFNSKDSCFFFIIYFYTFILMFTFFNFEFCLIFYSFYSYVFFLSKHLILFSVNVKVFFITVNFKYFFYF